MADSNLTVQIEAEDRFSPVAEQLLAELPDCSSKLVGAALCRLERIAKLCSVHSKRARAGRAGELRIVLEPSKAFAKLVAAVRAGDVDAL